MRSVRVHERSERMDDDGEEEERSTRSLPGVAFARGIFSATYIKARYMHGDQCAWHTRTRAGISVYGARYK